MPSSRHRRQIAALPALLACLLAGPASGRDREGEGRPAPAGKIAGRVTVLGKEGPRPATAAVVYVERADPQLWREAAGRGELRMQMQNKRFQPRVLTVVAGSEVSFPNLDPVYHNVFSRSGKNDFDLGLYKDGASKARVFRSPGLVRVFCNIHPSMRAYILVVQNPWFGATDDDGRFAIDAVSPGSYTVKAWDEKGGEVARELTVEAGKTAIVEFELDARGYREIPHKNKFGQDYGRDAY